MGAGRYPAELITLSQGSSTVPSGPSQTMLPSFTSLSRVLRYTGTSCSANHSRR